MIKFKNIHPTGRDSYEWSGEDAKVIGEAIKAYDIDYFSMGFDKEEGWCIDTPIKSIKELNSLIGDLLGDLL